MPRSPSLKRVGVFGSYGRGTASVGSDLDLLLVDDQAEGPQHQRLIGWPLEQLPLSCDALVLTPKELEELLARVALRAAPASHAGRDPGRPRLGVPACPPPHRWPLSAR